MKRIRRAAVTMTLVACSLAFASGPAGASTAGLAPAPGSPFATGGVSPIGLATGDFNGDHRLDVVTAHGGSNDVSVQLGDGQGALTPAPGSPFPTHGEDSYSVATGDFNNDHELDVIVASPVSDSVTVLLGDGQGRLAPAPGSPLQGFGFPIAVATADFDRDGNLDAAVVNARGASVSLLLGTGDGRLSGPAFAIGGFDPISLTTGDFDRDGNLDVAVPNDGTQELRIMLGDGRGGLARGFATSSGGDSVAIAAGDLNGDGNLDLVIANFYAGNVTVLLGDGGGRFTLAPGSPRSPGDHNASSVAIADFNLDGKADVAVANVGSVSILLGDGTGELSLAPGSPFSPGGGGAFNLTAADLNSDGRPDIVTSNFFSHDVSVLLNYGSAQKLCQAERISMGESAFEARFGSNGNGANAFGKCVSQSKGF